MAHAGNFVFEEILNSLTHGLGFIASVVGTILLMSRAAEPGTSPYHFWSCMIFSLCLMILYLSSTLYHRYHTQVMQFGTRCLAPGDNWRCKPPLRDTLIA